MLYRVDKRKFQTGDVITPYTSYEEIIDEERKEMEFWLNKLRPKGMPERSQCLFLFQNLIDALRFSSKFGGFVYGVSLQGCKLFVGDMNKLDNILDIFRFTDDENLWNTAVIEYWKGVTHTFSPCYEILACSARVEMILWDQHDVQKLRDELNLFSGNIECTSIYRNLLQIVGH